ncbi:hypothetical protein CA615_04240, partial [Methanosphaera stadtmanae]
ITAALHTPEGAIIYANDFKFDNHQMVSPPPDYRRFRELGKKGVKVAIMDTTNIKEKQQSKTHSEKIARDLLKDVLK